MQNYDSQYSADIYENFDNSMNFTDSGSAALRRDTTHLHMFRQVPLPGERLAAEVTAEPIVVHVLGLGASRVPRVIDLDLQTRLGGLRRWRTGVKIWGEMSDTGCRTTFMTQLSVAGNGREWII